MDRTDLTWMIYVCVNTTESHVAWGSTFNISSICFIEEFMDWIQTCVTDFYFEGEFGAGGGGFIVVEQTGGEQTGMQQIQRWSETRDQPETTTRSEDKNPFWRLL